MADYRNRFGPHDPDETYVAHGFPEHLADLGEVQMNYAVVGDAARPALLLIPGQTESWWGYEAGAAAARRALPGVRRRPARAGSLHPHARALHARQHGQRPRAVHRPRHRPADDRQRAVVRRRARGLAVGVRQARPGRRRRTTRIRRCSPRRSNRRSGRASARRIGAVFRLWSTYLGDQWSIGDWDGVRRRRARRAAGVARRRRSRCPPSRRRHLKEYDPEWGRAFWTGSVAASLRPRPDAARGPGARCCSPTTSATIDDDDGPADGCLVGRAGRTGARARHGGGGAGRLPIVRGDGPLDARPGPPAVRRHAPRLVRRADGRGNRQALAP